MRGARSGLNTLRAMSRGILLGIVGLAMLGSVGMSAIGQPQSAPLADLFPSVVGRPRLRSWQGRSERSDLSEHVVLVRREHVHVRAYQVDHASCWDGNEQVVFPTCIERVG